MKEKINFLKLRPKLIINCTFSSINDNQYLLYHPSNDEILKLTNNEYLFIEKFNGENSILDILEDKFSSSFSLKVSKIISILYELEKNNFLESPIFSSKKTKMSLNKKIHIFNFNFKKNIRKIILNNFFTFIYILSALSMFIYTIDKQYSSYIMSNFTNNQVSFSLINFITIYLTIILTNSLKTILLVSFLTDKKKKNTKIFIKFFYGLIFLSYNKNGYNNLPQSQIRKLSVVKLFFPLVLGLFIYLLNNFMNIDISIIINTLFILFFIDISPFFKNNLSDFIKFNAKKTKSNMVFGKIFFLDDIFNYDLLNLSKNNIFLLMIYAFIWFIISFLFFYYFVMNFFIRHNISNLNLISCLILYTTFYIPYIISNIFNTCNSQKNKIIELLNSSAIKKINSISEKYKNKLHLSIFEKSEFLKSIPLFSDYKDSELNEISKYITVERYNKGKQIVSSGEYGEYFYIILNGNVNVTIKNSDGENNIITTLGPSHMFGEIALIMDIPRTASIVCKTVCTIFQIDKTTFYNSILYRDDMKMNLTEFIRLCNFLINSSKFENLSAYQIKNVIKKLKKAYYRKNEIIFFQGDIGDNWYLIYSGKVKINRIENGFSVLDVTLNSGDYFGEIALIKNTIRTASASIASDDAIIFYLTKNDFLEIIEQNISIAIHIDATAHERLYELGQIE